jgi:AcrR family transcriptional regulator
MPVRASSTAVLDRGEVAEIQRVRMVGAIGELVRERGGALVCVADIVARSGISRRTFYEHFEDREACFLAAFDRAVTSAGDHVKAACRDESERWRWRERIRAALAALLEFCDTEPEQAYLLVVGALAAGPVALERRTAATQQLVAAVHDGGADARGEQRPERLVAEGVVGAVLAVLQARMLERDPEPLMSLLNPLMGMIVLPYLGAAAARRELARPAPFAVPRPVRRSRPSANLLRELDMRLTYRTVRVLRAIAAHPSASNREVSVAAGISDQGQVSKLLARLRKLGLIDNTAPAATGSTKGEPNAWTLTDTGRWLAESVSTPSVGYAGTQTAG